MEQSWNAEGLVEKAWERLGVTNGRDSLAQLTGIPATNLSSINTGNRRLTVKMARKISAATGASLLELGAPLRAVEEEDQNLYDLLAAARDEARRGREALLVSLGAIDVRLSRIEARLGLQDDEAKGHS